MRVWRSSSFAFLRDEPGSKLDGLHDARVAAAAAQMAIHRLANFAFTWLGVVRKQFGALDDHAIVTVAALRSLLFYKGLLQRMKRRWIRQIALPCVERR